jgi:hypothetical protein
MKTSYAIALACFVASPSVARAHSKLDQPPPVNTSDANKNPTGPCGTIPATPIQTQFAANGSLTVTWYETVNHIGAYEIRFADSGPSACTLTGNGGAVEPTNAQTNNVANKICPTLLTPAIADGDDPTINQADPTTWKKYTKSVTMPNTTCTNCIVQLIQWMGSGAGAAKTFTPYYSCARVTTQTPPPIPDMTGMPPEDMAMGGGGAGGTGGGGGGGGGIADVPDMAVAPQPYNSMIACSFGGGGASSAGALFTLLPLLLGRLATRRRRRR